MKYLYTSTLFICAFLFASNALNAQKLAFNFGLGIGNSYMVENRHEEDRINYNMSGMSRMGLKFTADDAYFGLKAEFMYVSTNYNYDYGWTNYGGGNVTTYTTALLLEHINQKYNWSFGYNFGMGYTKEIQELDYGVDIGEKTYKYTSLMFSGFLSIKMGQKSALRLTPTLLWTDPVHSFSSDNWVRAREDISLLWSLGIQHNIN